MFLGKLGYAQVNMLIFILVGISELALLPK